MLKRGFTILTACFILVGMAGDPEDLQEVTGFPIVHDGDDLRFPGFGRVRLVGVDAFEGKQQCARQGQCYNCGQAARRHFRSLMDTNKNGRAQREVTCRLTGAISNDRPIGICSVQLDGEAVDLSERMIADGWAIATTRYMDAVPQLRDRYEAAFAAARAAKRGAHEGRFVTPAAWKRQGKKVQCARKN